MTRIVILSRRDITHPLSGGAGRYVHEIFRRLATRYSVTVLAEGGPSSKSVEEIDGITYRHFPGILHRMLLPARYVTRFAGKTDLLIDNCDVGIPWLTPLYSRMPRITIVHQLVREIFYSELRRPLSSFGVLIEPSLYRLYSRSVIVAASHSTTQDLRQFGIPIEQITIVRPGCNLDHSSRKPMRDRSFGAVICVGRLKRYKGIQHALRAFRFVVENNPSAVLRIAGSGPYESQLRDLAKQICIEKSVQFLGQVSENEKFDLLSDSQLMVSPSMREGYGISVIEANSVGTPAVGWDVAGIRDSIIDGKTGLLAPFPDERALANKLEMLLNDDSTWSRLSNQAFDWARMHSWEESASRFESIIERVCAKG